MSTTIEIFGGEEGLAYKVLLEVKRTDTILMLAQNPLIHTKQGEDLIQALTLAAKDDFVSIKRFLNGRLNDSPEGKPAVQLFDGGKVYWEGRYQNGNLNDGVNGEAAVQSFRDDGQLQVIARFKDGNLVENLQGRNLSNYLRRVHQEERKKSGRKSKPPQP